MSFVKPYRPVTAQTLAHWVKSLLKEAGVDTTVFTAYSAKHAAVSRVISRGIDIDIIRRTVGCSGKSKAFARFCSRPVQNSKEAFAVLMLQE